MVDTRTLESVLDKTAGIVAGVGEDQLAGPTPCSEYTVAQLRDHIVGWSRVFAAAAAGQTPPAADGYESPDPAGDFRAAADQAVAALSELSDDAPVRLMGGGLPASATTVMMTGEYLAHGWDLAVATGQPVPFTEEEAVAGMALSSMLLPEFRGPGKSFGEIVPTPDDAPALDKFLALAGRNPRWQR